MRILYSIILYLSVPLALLRLVWRSRAKSACLKRMPERFGFASGLCAARPVIWIHAVSVGEVHAAAALVVRLREDYPGHQLLLTTTTETGAGQVARLFADEVVHRYLPFDLPGSAARFLRAVRPRMLALMETEIWPNMLHYCRRYGVPAVLINARLSSRSYRGYLRFRGLFTTALQALDHVAAQSDQDAQRFLSLGVASDRVSMSGNLKFDITPDAQRTRRAQALRQSFGAGRPVWMAASTHEGEEQLVLEALAHIQARLPDCLLIIAPRHPQRFDKVYRLCCRHGFDVCRRRANTPEARRRAQVYLLDSLGELTEHYGCADVAFIGGSLMPAGGHNLLEAAVSGVAVVCGKHTYNFSEIIRQFEEARALTTVTNASELADAVLRLLTDSALRQAQGQRGKALLNRNSGALDSVMVLLHNHLAK